MRYLWVGVLGLVLGAITGRGEEAERPPAGVGRPDLGLGWDRFDYLWLFDEDRVEKSSSGKQLKERLSGSRVPGVTEASRIAAEYRHRRGGVTAQESSGVVALLRLGRDARGLGKTGDFVWVVRFIHLGGTARQVVGGVTQELWIGASTGEVRAVLP